jgi:hypothetical protein
VEAKKNARQVPDTLPSLEIAWFVPIAVPVSTPASRRSASSQPPRASVRRIELLRPAKAYQDAAASI